MILGWDAGSKYGENRIKNNSLQRYVSSVYNHIYIDMIIQQSKFKTAIL